MGLHHQHRKEYAVACAIFERALQIDFPENDVLFVETDMYHFLLPLEYAVACYWLGRHEEAIAVTDALLRDPSVTGERRALLLRNRQFSVDRLLQQQSSPS